MNRKSRVSEAGSYWPQFEVYNYRPILGVMLELYLEKAGQSIPARHR